MRGLDLAGMKFGRLSVIETVGSNGGMKLWRCVCECGTETIVTSNALNKNHTKSCGCRKKEAQLENCFKFKRVSFTSKPRGEASLRRLIVQYKSGARKRGIGFSLTDAEAKIFFDGDCFYCGARPSTIMSSPKCNGEYIYNGIDRLNNDEGYTLENCVSCCSLCNHIKSDVSLNDFMAQIERIHSNRVGKV